MEKRHKLYFFKCPKCGEYQTDGETFKNFCTPKALQTIQDKKEAVGGLIEFKHCCPKCEPVMLDTHRSHRKIILLKPKRRDLN